MRNIPIFTTEYGIASLTLAEIPYSGAAYVRVQQVSDAGALLETCRDFCRAAGAARIYATGCPMPEERYPLYTALLRMERPRRGLEAAGARAVPVTRETAETWRELYNQKMAAVPNAAHLTAAAMAEMLARGESYFVTRGETLLGIGAASAGQIKAVASFAPGAGGEVVSALASVMTEAQICLEVASANGKAVALYERLGFAVTGELARWYEIFPDLSRKNT